MPDTLETAQRFISITQTYFCAMYAVVLWDWVTSLQREYLFIWRTKWTPVKVAYLLCRYWVIAVIPYLLYCFVQDHPLEKCERIFRIPVALAMWNQVWSEVVLLIRTYAFFNRNVYVLGSLCCTLAGVIAYQLYVDTRQMLLLPFVTPPFTHGPCLPMSKPGSAHLLGFFIAPLLFDTIVTSMTIWKAVVIRRQHGGPNSRLIQTFLREGVFYYILISVANLVNGIFYLQPRQVISAINIPLSVMLGPVLACRLVLDLRERGSERVSHSEVTTFTTKSYGAFSPNNTPPHRNKSAKLPNYRGRQREANIVLTTLGSIQHDSSMSFDQDVSQLYEIHDPRRIPSRDMDLGTLSTAVGGEDGEPVNDDIVEEGRRSLAHSNSSRPIAPPTPTYQPSEMGFRSPKLPRAPSLTEGGIGIRVEVEKATVTM